VGRLADDDGVDVPPAEAGVLERARRRLAHQPGERDVLPLGGVLRLPDTDDRATVHAPPSSKQTRFCWRQGPLVAWATARRALPSITFRAAAPTRVRPATMIGFEETATT